MGKEASKADLIIKEYMDKPGLTNNYLAKMFNVTPQYVGKILRPYKSDKVFDIKHLFFEEKLNITEISLETQVSAPTIRKYLKTFGKKYYEELELRKQTTKENSKRIKREYAEQRRLKLKEDQLVHKELMRLQNINALSMSTSRKITTKDLIIQNLGHYAYNEDKTCLVFKENWELPIGIPRVAKLITTNINEKMYEKGIDGKTISK